jgi:hypothetical protein
MSEQNTAANADNADAGTKVTGKTKTSRANARTDFTKIIAAHAKRRGIDTTRAGKEVRAKARREFDKLCKLDPSLTKVKSSANDGNRWPALNANATKHLLTKGTAKS